MSRSDVVITTDMGPCHVGPGVGDHPTLLNYRDIYEAMERQHNFIRRNIPLQDLKPGYMTRFYLEIDGEVVPVGKLIYKGIVSTGGIVSPPRHTPTVEWEYEAGFCGPDANT